VTRFAPTRLAPTCVGAARFDVGSFADDRFAATRFAVAGAAFGAVFGADLRTDAVFADLADFAADLVASAGFGAFAFDTGRFDAGGAPRWGRATGRVLPVDFFFAATCPHPPLRVQSSPGLTPNNTRKPRKSQRCDVPPPESAAVK
jgi:hypothetical protein